MRCSRSVLPDPDIYHNGESGFAPRCAQQPFCRSHILPRVQQRAPIISLKRASVVHRRSRSSDVNLCKWSRRGCAAGETLGTFFPPGCPILTPHNSASPSCLGGPVDGRNGNEASHRWSLSVFCFLIGSLFDELSFFLLLVRVLKIKCVIFYIFKEKEPFQVVTF